MKQLLLELTVSLILAAMSAFLLIEAWSIRAPANIFPAAILLTVCGLAIISLIRTAMGIVQATGRSQYLPIDWGRVSILAGGAVTYAVLLPLDYVLTTSLLLFTLYLSFARSWELKTIASRAVIALGLTLVAYYGFSELLGVDLPRGAWL